MTLQRQHDIPPGAAVLMWRLWFYFHVTLRSHIISASDILDIIHVHHKYYYIIICHYPSVIVFFFYYLSGCCCKISPFFCSLWAWFKAMTLERFVHVCWVLTQTACLMEARWSTVGVCIANLPAHPFWTIHSPGFLWSEGMSMWNDFALIRLTGCVGVCGVLCSEECRDSLEEGPTASPTHEMTLLRKALVCGTFLGLYQELYHTEAPSYHSPVMPLLHLSSETSRALSLSTHPSHPLKSNFCHN